jgi:hypothetical protein
MGGAGHLIPSRVWSEPDGPGGLSRRRVALRKKKTFATCARAKIVNQHRPLYNAHRKRRWAAPAMCGRSLTSEDGRLVGNVHRSQGGQRRGRSAVAVTCLSEWCRGHQIQYPNIRVRISDVRGWTVTETGLAARHHTTLTCTTHAASRTAAACPSTRPQPSPQKCAQQPA